MPRYPEGTYRARAIPTGHRLGKSKNKGTDQSEVEFELLGEGFQGSRITYVGYYTEKTEDRTLESLRIAGWTGEDILEDPLPGLGSTEVDLVIEDNEFEGKTHSRVAWVNKVGAMSVGAPMDDAQRKSFADRMRGKILAQRQGNGATHPAASNDPKDRVPF